MPLSLIGLGTAVPTATLNQAEARAVAESLCCDTAEQATFVPAIYAGTGIANRHICLGRPVVRDILDGTRLSGSPYLPTGDPGERGPTTHQRMQVYDREAAPLARKAAAEALAAAGVLPGELTHLVTVSCTGFAAPGFDVALVNDLGMSPDVARTHVGFMGCHGALNGLRVAHAFASDPAARVLVCSVELCSVHYHYGWDPPKVVANALFADGAAAAVCRAGGTQGWKLIANGSHLIPEAASTMTWSIGDHGFGMTLSKKIPDVIAANLRGWLGAWLGKHGVRLADVRSWAVHPGGPKILDAVAAALGLPDEALWASREILAEYGNMSSATGLFILKRLHDRGAAGPCVALGFGPGLNVEAALLD
ncbi:MAG TPA: type III polyketide synthase [Gemmataceae bacterium]|jgi:predicted naringenin-chalcone synthase|nr:type III polyketide synthase [Gemmataceae bacterium]